MFHRLKLKKDTLIIESSTVCPIHGGATFGANDLPAWVSFMARLSTFLEVLRTVRTVRTI